MSRSGVLGIAAALAALCALPAVAAGKTWRTGGITYVQKGGQRDGSYLKLKVPCPSGTHVLGGGELSSAGFSVTRLHHTFPIDDGDRRKAPDDGWGVRIGNSGTHKYLVYAICSKRSPRYVTKKQAANANDQTNNSVDCPAGTSAVAGGHKGPTALTANSGWPTTGYFTYFIDNPTGSPLPITGYAVCVKFGVSYAQGTVFATPGAESFAEAACPGNRHVVGGGLSNGGGLNQILIDSSWPADHLGDEGAAPDDEWSVAVHNTTGAQISVSAVAACAPSLG